ncbi:hypothetical protein [Fulvivirga lutimaris]|uniref:hypothetical protein n=1 Tax=Fulvivirga lutimaris TaxID=1819566 RepID=UPI0012BD51F2|nr:hypothetical protein [Fulvivirga lutimaris]MTI41056.1 hypothetical protein [Fulvivirga lutimaris]
MKNLIVFLSLVSIFSLSNLEKPNHTSTSTSNLEVSVDETYLRITIERMRRPERFYNKKNLA